MRIFLSYAHEDRERVSALYQRLLEAGFDPWMDEKRIQLGEEWDPGIYRAILSSDFFLFCLSSSSIGKLDQDGYLNRELNIALKLNRKMRGYVIPTRLESCETPRRLRRFQWVDLFQEDGFVRLKERFTSTIRQTPPPKRDFGAYPVMFQGAIIYRGVPEIEVQILARAFAGNDITIIKKEKIDELENRLGVRLPSSKEFIYRDKQFMPALGDLQPAHYPLGFVFPDGSTFSCNDGCTFMVPEEWPFGSEDIWLGRDILDHVSLSFTRNGTLSIKRRK